MADDNFPYDLPLDPAPAPSLGFSGEAGTGDTGAPQPFAFQAPSLSDMEAPDQRGGMSPLAVEGLGLAKESYTEQNKRYMDELPTHQRVGLALQAFSAGVAGKPSPVDAYLARRRGEDKEGRAELKANVDAMTKAMEEIRKFGPDTIQGRAVKNAYKQILGPKLGAALDMVGTDREDEVRSLTGLVADPDVQKALADACSGSKDRMACWTKQVNDKEWMSQQQLTVDTKRIGGMAPKLRALNSAIKRGELKEFENADGRVELTWAQIAEMNEKFKLFSPAEMETLSRRQDTLIPYGVVTTKALEAGQVEGAKQDARPDKTFKEGDTRRIFDPAGNELQQEFKNGQWATIGRKVKEPKPDKPLTLAQERHDQQILDARLQLKEQGVKSIEDVKKREDKTIQSGPKYGQPNPDHQPGVMGLWRRAGEPLYADTKEKREAKKAGGAAPAPAADKPKEAPKPAAKPPALSEGDRKRILDEATAAVNKGADQEAVKKRLKEKYGIDVSFQTATKK